MNFDIIKDNYPILLHGAWTTLWIVFSSLFIGILIAIPTAVMANSKNPFLRLPAAFYSYVFRGTPLLIQLYLFYYGFGLLLGNIPGIKETFWWTIISQAWPWAIIASTLNTGAYTCEIIRGFIATTDKREIEAAKAYGMNKFTMLRRIILPSALRRSLPAYGNEVIYMLHGSAIVSTITILDLTGAARMLRDKYYDTYTPFIAAALMYLCITLTIVFIFKRIEKRYLKHLVR